MRAALLTTALTAVASSILAIPAPAQTFTCARSSIHLCRHAAVGAIHRHEHVARDRRPYHIPRFDQAEAEAYVHTVYPYRTGLYVPWPDAYGAPYPY